jgi:hypothetical protein
MTNRYDSDNARDRTERETDRYAAFSDGTGEVVVYDTENDDAWVKCDAAVELAEMA